jgi:hypothetical protein
MRILSNVLVAAALTALASAPAGAHQTVQTPTAAAVKAAADATSAARKITFRTRDGSGFDGSVGLYRIGRSRTRILVTLPAGKKYRVTVYPGSDCTSNRTATAADVALMPTNFNKTGAASQSTIISLPIQKVQSNYVVDVRDANDRTALTAACARLNR